MKNLSQMRALVFEEITKLQNGKSNEKRLNAIVSALSFVLATAKLELEYAKALDKAPKLAFVEVDLEPPEESKG